jgi:hypothetical protein
MVLLHHGEFNQYIENVPLQTCGGRLGGYQKESERNTKVSYGLDSSGSKQGSVAVSWEHATETSGTIKYTERLTG